MRLCGISLSETTLCRANLIACAEQKVGDEQCLGAGEGQVSSTAALQKKKALGLSAEEQDEEPYSIWGTGMEHPLLSPCGLIIPSYELLLLDFCIFTV